MNKYRVIVAALLSTCSLGVLFQSSWAHHKPFGIFVVHDDVSNYKYFMQKDGRITCQHHEWSNVTSNHSLTHSPCYTTTLFDEKDVKNGRQKRSKEEGPRFIEGSDSVPDIFILVVESLSLKKFNQDMPLTRKVLDDLGGIWFPNFHVRMGGTRENLPGLLLGQFPKYNISFDHGTSTSFDISRETLNETALWKVAQRNGFETLHGSTACNMLFGLHHMSTSDGYDFHNTLKNFTDFDYTFPNGAYYQNKQTVEDCYSFREVRDSEGMLRCTTAGPYHHKFYEFYKVFSAEVQRPKFTVVHLYETHGNSIAWPLDFHTSRFINWMGERQNTIIAFMGDHGDATGTPLGLVFPQNYGRDIAYLRRFPHTFVLAENLHSFFKNIMQTKDVKRSSVDFLEETFQNRCDGKLNLRACFCKAENDSMVSLEFDESLVNSAVKYIRDKTSSVCQSYELLNYSVPVTSGSPLRVIIYFTNTAIYEVVFQSKDQFQVKQLTRYQSQIVCSPEGTHPRFCICNMTTFREGNANSNQVSPSP